MERGTGGGATAGARSATAARGTAKRARQRHATKATPATATRSAAKLDCENEMRRPSQQTARTPIAAHARRTERPRTIRTMLGTIATTRKRPYTDGSQKTELTRKKPAYAFDVITFGFSKTL